MPKKSNKEYDAKVKKVIRSEFFMISSSADHQQSEEAYNTSKFALPNPAGKSGGACTSTFLQAMYDNGDGASWVETLQQMGTVLRGMGYNQTPQLSCSRLIEVNKEMFIVPPKSGRRRALLIGINYVGQEGSLQAPHNDVNNLKEFLTEVYDFQESEMLILMDDGRHHPPTRRNIEDGMIRLTRYSQPGDVAFVSFSGHGGNTEDLDGDESDGFDETLIPVDFRTEGHIVDDDILKLLVKPMAAGVHTTVLMDCCHSGSVLDLPYKFGANDARMTREEGFNFDTVAGNEDKKKAKKLQTVDDEEETPNDNKKQKKKGKTKKVTKEQKEREKSIVVGPKTGADGAPALPIRKAAPKPPPPPKKKCIIM